MAMMLPSKAHTSNAISTSQKQRTCQPSCTPETQKCYPRRSILACQSARQHEQLTATQTRRTALLSLSFATAIAFSAPSWALTDVQTLEGAAFEAYANRDFQAASTALTQIMQQEPELPRWREMRAQVLVDGKNFDAALQDFDAALQLTPDSDLVGRARLIAGRALAYEGLGEWRAALNDYTTALDLAAQGGERPDPYVINSRGNCYNSLGLWAEAREDYLISSQLFQQAKGFRGRGGSTTQRLDEMDEVLGYCRHCCCCCCKAPAARQVKLQGQSVGQAQFLSSPSPAGAIFAASNAALMLAQIGDQQGAIKEMERIARRAPGSADMRAALAALYWSQGRPEAAEDQWEFACEKINVGCTKYQDRDWLTRIRRWPPRMADLMTDFLQLKQRAAA